MRLSTVQQPANGKPQAANGKPDGKATASTTTIPVWEFLADPERDRDGTGTWLYRAWPVIDRKQGEHAICRKKGRFSRDEILKDFGSGIYSVQVNDAKGRQLYLESISFHHPDHPPRMDPLEVVVGDPRNDKYFATWGKPASAAPTAAVKPDGAAAKSETADIAAILRAHSEGSKLDPQVVSWLQDMANHRDDLAAKLAEASAKNPTADLASLISAVKSLMPAQTGAAVDPLAIVDKVMAIQNRNATDVDRIWKLAERVQARAPESNADPLGTVEKTLGLFTQMRDLLKPEAAVAPTAAADGAATLGQEIAANLAHVPGILSGIATLVSAFRSNPNVPPPGAAAAPSMPTPPQAFDPYRSPELARAFARAQSPQQPNPQNPPPPPPPPPPGQPSPAPDANSTPNPADAAPEAGMVNPVVLITKALDCMNRGYGGSDFAESVIISDGDLAYRQIVSQIRSIGVAGVLTLAKQLPQLAQQVIAYEEPLTEFIHDFIDRPEHEENDEEAEGKSAAA